MQGNSSKTLRKEKKLATKTGGKGHQLGQTMDMLKIPARKAVEKAFERFPRIPRNLEDGMQQKGTKNRLELLYGGQQFWVIRLFH